MYLAVFFVALIARAGWGIFRYARGEATGLEFPDEQQYWLMAESLARGEGLQDELGFRATRMPLYPSMLALFTGWSHGLLAARALHWILGALAAVLAARLADRLFDRPTAWIGGLLVACDPFLIFFSSLLLTETPFLVALLLLWLASAPMLKPDVANARRMWHRWALVGCLAALCVHVRESSLGLAIVLFGFMVIVQRFRWPAIGGAVMATTIIMLSLVPWAARNHALTGQWCWLTHRAGISLYDGVGPMATGASDLGDIKQMPAVAGMSEVEWNDYFLRESYREMRDSPGRIVRLGFVKLARMWNPFPNVEEYQSRMVRWVAAGWSLPVYALALCGVLLLAFGRRALRNSPTRLAGGLSLVLFLLLPALYLSALHSVFIGSVRYRLGAMPMIELLAAFAGVWLWTQLISRKRRGL